MRILVIDYITYLGHRNFNKIHVESLIRLGHDIHVVGRESALSCIEHGGNLKTTYLPSWSSYSLPISSISERVKNIALLLWVKRKLPVQDYDLVIFLAYDILSLSFYKNKKSIILVNHNNVSQLDNRFKLYLTKRFTDNYVHVVLTEDTRIRLMNLLGRDSVKYIPHGFVCDRGEAIKPNYLNGGEKYLFCPINNNYDAKQVVNLFSSSVLMEFLKNHNIFLIIKSSLVGNIKHQNLVSLNKRIPEAEYRYLLRNAMAVILPYSNAFRYRSSGILFECISMNTPVIATRIESMSMYKDLIQIKYFGSDWELVENICYYLNSPRSKVDNSIFVPDNYWKHILFEINCNK